MNIFRTPPVLSQNSSPFRRPPSMSPKVATTEATPRTIPTIWRRLRLLWAPMSTMPSTTESQSEKQVPAQKLEAGHAGPQRVTTVVLDAAVHDLDDALAALGDARVVGDDHDRLAPGVQPVEDLEDLEAGLRVEVAGGLVGEDRATARSRAPGRWPPAGAAPRRARTGRCFARSRRPTRSRAGARQLLALRPADPGIEQGQLHVAQQRGLGQQVEGLEDEADLLVADRRELEARELVDVLRPPGGRSRRWGRRGSPGCASGSTCRSRTGR